jgi:hypothetical protein
MKNFRLASISGVALFYTISGFIALSFMGCGDQSIITRDQSSQLGKTIHSGRHEGPGSFTDHPNGDRYPYPEIIKNKYIPPYDLFSHTHCMAWRITWPAYAGSADVAKIPTVFATGNGALNSFYYLDNVDPLNTYKTKFSLYYENKVATSNTMWDELKYTFYAPANSMESVWFAKVDQPVDIIQFWVTERPDQFENHWPGNEGEELTYGEGDFFIYYLTDQNLYGGIRIVSMSPRIIEVYLAVPS